MDLGCQNGRVSVVTPPTLRPVSVAEVEAHMRLPQNAETNWILDAIEAAVGEIDAPAGWLGRSLAPRTLRLTLDAAPPPIVYLPGPPVLAVKTIKVRGSDDAITTVYDADADPAVDELELQFDLTAAPALIWPSDEIGWPSDIKGGVDCMRIDYTAGYVEAAVPKTVKQWLLMRLGELYRDREASIVGTSVTRHQHADRMLDNYRVRA